MSDPYPSPFPDQQSAERTRGYSQYPDHYSPQDDQYQGQGADQYSDQYSDQYRQYREQYPVDSQPVTQQPNPQYPGEHYSSQAYVAPATRRASQRFPESDTYDRNVDKERRAAKRSGTPLGRIVLGVFLGLMLWTIVMGLLAVGLLATVAGKVENRLQDLDSSVHTTSAHIRSA